MRHCVSRFTKTHVGQARLIRNHQFHIGIEWPSASTAVSWLAMAMHGPSAPHRKYGARICSARLRRNKLDCHRDLQCLGKRACLAEANRQAHQFNGYPCRVRVLYLFLFTCRRSHSSPALNRRCKGDDAVVRAECGQCRSLSSAHKLLNAGPGSLEQRKLGRDNGHGVADTAMH